MSCIPRTLQVQLKYRLSKGHYLYTILNKTSKAASQLPLITRYLLSLIMLCDEIMEGTKHIHIQRMIPAQEDTGEIVHII